MATRLLCLNQKLQKHRRSSFECLTLWLRTVSSHNRNSSECAGTHHQSPTGVKSDPAFKWLNIRAGIFGPDDERLPLPGDVGMSDHFNNTNTEVSDAIKGVETPSWDSLITCQEKQLESLRLTQLTYSEINTIEPPRVNSEDVLECRIQKCPSLLTRDFQALFPNRNLKTDTLRVVTVCQKTKHDMSGWSEATEMEREELVDHFVVSAQSVCVTLMSQGFWSDFIDPQSGRPFLGPFTHATLFETDERYRHFGFRIEDLGCCKVISHRVWGTTIFVGALFTNAPEDAIEEALMPLTVLADV